MHITWPAPTLPPINLYNAPKAHMIEFEEVTKFKETSFDDYLKEYIDTVEGRGVGQEPNGKRPYGMHKAAKHNVYLDQYTWAKLRVIGKGNASEAIRKLVEQAP